MALWKFGHFKPGHDGYLLLDVINDSAVQHQEKEMISDFFQTVLFDFSLKSGVFLPILSFSK